MLLTNPERDFLAAFIHEATTDPFHGPATEELHRRNLYYTDISNLLAAYYSLEQAGEQAGSGRQRVAPPPRCPWEDETAALRRNEEVRTQLERLTNQNLTSDDPA